MEQIVSCLSVFYFSVFETSEEPGTGLFEAPIF